MIPYDFILERLYPLELRHKKMFGIDAFYYKEKIVFCLREKESNNDDNGVWIATKIDFHESLKEQIKDLRMIKMYPIKSWILLPADSDYFEEGVETIATLIKQNSPYVGVIPKPKKKKKKNTTK
ncbi:hypothetical protein [Aquimarina algicola]|uniref:MmcQ/YjbR family DNA-binding protein n=1 Tax=Aquimarina algicola TaxID=2589995 RepID=A0A504JEF8_9FLAO|nr:hypothetical protein [Aquimarina algicola]TPN89074.1 hypothetical protein FHK87_02310 [Aquimarina algicola]